MELAKLNRRWAHIGHPYAVLAQEEGYLWFCPACESGGEDQLSLAGAMSEALAHKNHCPAIDCPGG